VERYTEGNIGAMRRKADWYAKLQGAYKGLTRGL